MYQCKIYQRISISQSKIVIISSYNKEIMYKIYYITITEAGTFTFSVRCDAFYSHELHHPVILALVPSLHTLIQHTTLPRRAGEIRSPPVKLSCDLSVFPLIILFSNSHSNTDNPSLTLPWTTAVSLRTRLYLIQPLPTYLPPPPPSSKAETLPRALELQGRLSQSAHHYARAHTDPGTPRHFRYSAPNTRHRHHHCYCPARSGWRPCLPLLSVLGRALFIARDEGRVIKL